MKSADLCFLHVRDVNRNGTAWDVGEIANCVVFHRGLFLEDTTGLLPRCKFLMLYGLKVDEESKIQSL